MAIYGGLNPPPDTMAIQRPSGWQSDWTVAQGQAPGATVTEPEPDPLAAAMSLVDAAGKEQAQPFPRILVFNLFGQGVAYFQSVRTLVAASQPTEALFPLRALAAIAARFEQMCGSDNGGRGVAVRLALDAVANSAAEAHRDVHATQAELLQAAAARGIQHPEDLASVEDTVVWRSLHDEMRLADIAENPFGIVGLHLQQGASPDHLGFHTPRWRPDRSPTSLPRQR